MSAQINTAIPNPLLSGMYRQSMLNTEGLIAPFLFPENSVGLESSTYYVWSRENALSVPTLKPRKDGAGFNRVTMKADQDSYICLDYGVETVVSDVSRQRFSTYFAADRQAVERLSTIIKLNREMRAYALATSATVSQTSSPSTKWDAANSTPIKDLKTARRAIRQACGLRPNICVMSETVFDILTENSDVKSRLPTTGLQDVTEDALARLIGVKRVVLAMGMQNTANEGQSLSAAEIWGEDVILAYVDPSDNLEAMSFGKDICWRPFDSGSADAPLIKTYREENLECDTHRAREYCVEKITSAVCGYRLSNTLST
jgi:hypothetical protein